MKRGLVVLDPAEIPDEEWTSRVSRLQQRMTAEGVSVALIYGDVFRSDDIGYLTNLCIYWNEGMVAVPADGPPVFMTKLSPRVHPWMRATSPVSDLRSGKSFGPLVQALLAERQPGVVGIVDRPLWPADVVEEISAAAPGWEVRPLDGVVRAQRLVPSASELALLSDGARLLRVAVERATAPGLSTTERIATVEQELRGNGFTDVMTHVSTTTDGATSLEMTGEYRHGWLHLGRTLDADGAAWGPPLEAALRAVVGAIADGAKVTDLAVAAEPELASLPGEIDWHVSCVNQADMATNGELLGPSANSLTSGNVLVVGIEMLFGDGGRAVVAETVLVGPDGAELLGRTADATSVAGRKESSR